MIDGLTLGAYLLAPQLAAGGRKETKKERRWYEMLAEIDSASGLEVPFEESLHAHGPEGLARVLPPTWHIVGTMLTRTIKQLLRNPNYGLASPDDDGRRLAIDDVRAFRREAVILKDLRGDDVIRAIELHSAPRASPAVGTSCSAFAESLEEIASWEWGTTRIVIEHCDAMRPGHEPSKGFLKLSEETAAAEAVAESSRVAIGQAVNWGRSAIEGRSADLPLDHISALVAKGTLSAITFSGAQAVDGPLGGAWADVHNALDTDDPSSLLSRNEISESLLMLDCKALSEIVFLGVKISDATKSDDLVRRLQPLRNISDVTQKAWTAALRSTPLQPLNATADRRDKDSM